MSMLGSGWVVNDLIVREDGAISVVVNTHTHGSSEGYPLEQDPSLEDTDTVETAYAWVKS